MKYTFTKLSLLALAATLLAVNFANAAQPQHRKQKAAQWRKHHDDNVRDDNKNGKVSHGERIDWCKDHAGDPSCTGDKNHAYKKNGVIKGRDNKLNDNGGKLTKRELADWCRDHPKDEQCNIRTPDKRDTHVDDNKDGVISHKEKIDYKQDTHKHKQHKNQKIVNTRAEKHFDANGDGVLTGDEAKAYKESIKNKAPQELEQK